MKLKTILLVEDANLLPQDGSPKIMLIQPIFNFIVPFTPTQLSFSLMCGVSHFELGQKHKIDINFISPNGELINTIPWEIIDPSGHSIAKPSAMMVTGIKNLIIETEGEYRIELVTKGEKIGEYFFDVIKQERVKPNARDNT